MSCIFPEGFLDLSDLLHSYFLWCYSMFMILMFIGIVLCERGVPVFWVFNKLVRDETLLSEDLHCVDST